MEPNSKSNIWALGLILMKYEAHDGYETQLIRKSRSLATRLRKTDLSKKYNLNACKILYIYIIYTEKLFPRYSRDTPRESVSITSQEYLGRFPEKSVGNPSSYRRGIGARDLKLEVMFLLLLVV